MDERSPPDHGKVVSFGARRVRSAIVMAVVLLAAFGAIVISGGHSKSPRTSTDKPVTTTVAATTAAPAPTTAIPTSLPPTTTTTTEIPTTQPLGQAQPTVAAMGVNALAVLSSDGRLVQVTPSNGQTKLIATFDLTGSNAVRMIGLRSAYVLATGNDVQIVTTTGRTIALGRADAVLRDPAGDRFWLDVAQPEHRATQYDLTGKELASFTIPGEARITGAATGGLVLVSTSGNDVSLVDSHTGIRRRTVPGHLLSAGGSLVVVRRCDTHDVCHNLIHDLSSGREHTVDPNITINEEYGYASPSGDALATFIEVPDGSRLAVIDAATGSILPLDNDGPAGLGPIGWSADGRWLVTSAAGHLDIYSRAKPGPSKVTVGGVTPVAIAPSAA